MLVKKLPIRKLSTLTLAIFILSTVSPTLGYSNDENPIPEEGSVEEALILCDRALNDCDQALSDCEEKGAKQQEIIETQVKEIENLKGENDSVIKKPFVWFILGSVALAGLGPVFAPLIGVGVGLIFK